MNAVSQSFTLKLTSKIAYLGVLFRAEFLGTHVDLRPWLEDRKTQSHLDPNSIDLSFHSFHQSTGLNVNCVLMQLKFSTDLREPTCRLSRIDANGFERGDEKWQFSTNTDEFLGISPPTLEAQMHFMKIVNHALLLFKDPHKEDSLQLNS
ncbi:hypothetical protein Lepto7376_2337 [[Leptolyngbya] sp. PCC 7376]|nr:hypothetical protein Lepto7376_2337 [[Leptolyngbya] sp. PCC 7376]